MKSSNTKPPQIVVEEKYASEKVTVEDVVQAIQRRPGSELYLSPTSTSNEETKSHTVGSRWSMMKSAIGIQKPRGSIYTGVTQHNDYQRILDEWIRICASQGTPLAQLTKISDEFKKRMNREGTHEAKEKLNFSSCDLNDHHLIALSVVLAQNPKIAFLDFSENNEINEVGVQAFNNLVICQLEAAKLLANDPTLIKATLINEIKWSKKQQKFVTPEVLQALDDLRVVNARIMIKNSFQSIGNPAVIDDEVNRKMWKKVVRRDSAVRLSIKQSLEYDTLENQLIIGMQENNLLPNPKKDNTRASIFGSRGSFFGGSTPGASPAQRQSVFSNFSSPALTPQNSVQKSSAAKSLFADVDDDKQDGKKEEPDNNRKISYALNGADEKLNESELKKNEVISVRNSEQELRLLREEEERKRLAQEELERKEKAEEEERLRLRVEEERKLRKLQEEQTLRLKKEEEERLRRQKAEEARLRKQREEEERLRKQEEEEEEERLRKLKEEEERLRKQQQEEEERLLKEIEQEQERLRIQQEEEERLRKEQQEEEDERLRKMIEEEEERLRLEKEEEERLHKQQQEEEEERLRKEQEELEEMQRLEAEERLRLQYEEEQSKLEAERLQKLKEEEEKQQLENTPSRSHDEIDIEFAVSDDTNAPISAIKASESEFEDGHGRRQSVDQSFDFISEIAESDLHSDFEREDSQQHIEEDRDTTTDAIAIENHDEQNVGEQSDLELSHMNEEDHDAHLVDTKENEVTREEEHYTTVSNSSEFYDNFQAETSGFAAVSRTADSGEDFPLHAASSHDSRYEHLELTELHLIHELVSTSEVEEVVTHIVGIVEAKENENHQEPPAMIALQLSNSSEKESSHKSSSSYDTTDPADSVVKNSHDSLDEKHHEDGEESLHEKGIEEDEEEDAVKDEDPCEESKAYESWQIDLDAHSDSELLDTDADNDGYDNYKPAEYEDVHFDYDMIHRKESEFDEFPPISEIILQTRSNLDTSAFSATNPLYGTRSIDEETLTENPVQDEERQNDSVTSVEFDERDTSSQGYSDAMELEENEDVLQCAQVLETSDLPRCLNLTNTQRTDSNINWNKYLTSDQFEKVRILILKDNFFTDLESLRLRECFPKLRELDFTRNYLSGELTTKVFSSRLRKLDLSRNQISNIKGLIYCKRLEELNVSHNRIRFLDPLPQTLTVLDISCNWIDSATTFRALSRNHRLHEIDISGNNIATIKNIEGTIKTLVPGLLKSTIIYDRMLVKRRTSPRFKIGSPPKGNKNNNHPPSAQVSPSSIVVNAKESPGSSNYASPSKDESFLFHHSMHVNPRLEEASKALRSNEAERQHAERQAYLKRAKEFSGKVREQQQQQHTLKKTNDHSSRASAPSLIPIAKGKFSAQNNNKQNPALQSAPSFMSEITASSTTTAQSKLKKGSFMSESFISVQSYQTGRTGITVTSAAPSLSVGGTHASSVVRRQSNSSATSAKSSGGLNHQGSTHKVNGNKIVNHWLTKTQNRLNRCVSIFTMITELAKTELLLSSTTHYGLLQEWAKVGFFDLNPAVCSFTPLVKPEFLARENIIEMDDDYCEVPIVDIECAEKLWNELNDFHSLFIQIYMALEISILHQVNFRALFEPIMKKKIGSRVNERLNHVYEFSDDEERIFSAY